MKKYIFLIIISTNSLANLPTIDIANIVQTTISALKNIEQVGQVYTQIDNQLQQINKLKEQFDNMNGDYFKQLLLNSTGYKKARRWIPSNFRDVLDMYRGLYPYQAYQEAAFAGWEARNDYYIYDTETYYEENESIAAQRWAQYNNNSVAAIGIAESSFERATGVISETERLIDDMGSSPDQKAALDLSNRMSAQLQFLLAELIRVQSSQAAANARNELYTQAQKGEDLRISNNTHVTSIF